MMQIYGYPGINQDCHMSCEAYNLEIWVMSTDTDIDMQSGSALALPQACWDWRSWSAAFSSLGRRCQSGCWMTTWTLRRCWRRSVTTKWPPSSLTPMLLSPISSSRRSASQDQYISSEPPTRAGFKVTPVYSTHSNTRGDLWFSLLYIHLGNSGYSHEGHAELSICKIIKQLFQSSTGYTFVVVTELTSIFTFSALWSSRGNNIYACLPATITYTLKKVFEKEHLLLGCGADVIQARSDSWYSL